MSILSDLLAEEPKGEYELRGKLITLRPAPLWLGLDVLEAWNAAPKDPDDDKKLDLNALTREQAITLENALIESAVYSAVENGQPIFDNPDGRGFLRRLSPAELWGLVCAAPSYNEAELKKNSETISIASESVRSVETLGGEMSPEQSEVIRPGA